MNFMIIFKYLFDVSSVRFLIKNEKRYFIYVKSVKISLIHHFLSPSLKSSSTAQIRDAKKYGLMYYRFNNVNT